MDTVSSVTTEENSRNVPLPWRQQHCHGFRASATLAHPAAGENEKKKIPNRDQETEFY
jgi:hypothetical protein